MFFDEKSNRMSLISKFLSLLALFVIEYVFASGPPATANLLLGAPWPMSHRS